MNSYFKASGFFASADFVAQSLRDYLVIGPAGAVEQDTIAVRADYPETRIDFVRVRLNRILSNNDEGGETTMVWEKPDFVEVRMDAEINCYVMTL